MRLPALTYTSATSIGLVTRPARCRARQAAYSASLTEKRESSSRWARACCSPWSAASAIKGNDATVTSSRFGTDQHVLSAELCSEALTFCSVRMSSVCIATPEAGICPGLRPGCPG